MTPAKREKSTENAAGTLPLALDRAIEAARGKQATDPVVLDLRGLDAFTDFFFICSGQNVRQLKAIADAIEESLRHSGVRPSHIEGYERAGWILIDCFDFVIHVFTPDTRRFYDLERLWGSATRIEMAEAAGG